MLTKWLGGIYRWVASAYDVMLTIASTSSFDVVKGFFDRVYMLFGIFMLFRMVVSFLTMLVDPDKLTDKKSGAGSILSRIVVSIVLLVSFQFIFPYMDRIQNALIAPKDGSSILWNILPQTGSSVVSELNPEDAASGAYQLPTGTEDGFSCYYAPYDLVGSSTTPSFPTFLTVHFSKNKVDASGYEVFEVLGTNDKTISSGKAGAGWYAYFNTDRSRVYGISKYKYFYGAQFIRSDGMFVSLGDNAAKFKGDKLDNRICPKSISNLFCAKYDENSPYACTAQSNTLKDLGLENASDEGGVSANGDGSFDSLLNYFSSEVNSTDSIGNEDTYYKEVTLPGYEQYVKDILDSAILQNGSSKAAQLFSNTLARSFVSRTIDDECDSECWNTAQKLGLSPKIDSDIDDLYDDNKIDISHLLGMIVGLIVIVILIVICIDVVVRNCKLLLLEAMSPVAAMSYINPDDKIFSTWLKQFIGTYLDLFIKVLSISLGIYFLDVLLQQINGSNIWIDVIIILGTISFIKILPGFVSKIFGISDMAGSFKDSFKILKAGVGLAAGATIGAAVGAATGFSAKGMGGRGSIVAGGLLGGAFRGAKSGSKGKIFEGANTQKSRNLVAKNAALYGASYGQRMLSRVGITGMRNKQNDIDVAKKKLSIQEAQQSIASAKMNELGGISKRAEKKVVDDGAVIYNKKTGELLGVEAQKYQQLRAQLDNLDRQKIPSLEEFDYNSYFANNSSKIKDFYVEKGSYDKFENDQTMLGLSRKQIEAKWNSDLSLRNQYQNAAKLEAATMSSEDFKDYSYDYYRDQHAKNRNLLEEKVEDAKNKAVDEYISIARDYSLDEGGDGEIKTRIENIRQYNNQERDLVAKYRDNVEKSEDRVNLTNVSGATDDLYNKNAINIRGMKGKLANSNAEGARNISQAKHDIAQMERDVKEQGISAAEDYSKNIKK